MTSGLLFQKPSLLVCLCVRFMPFIILSIGNETRNISSTRYIDQDDLVCNKPKGRISKRVFQENKARQIFPKNENFSPSDPHTYVCVSRGKKCSFFGKFGVHCFLEPPFWYSAFWFITEYFTDRTSFLPSNLMEEISTRSRSLRCKYLKSLIS